MFRLRLYFRGNVLFSTVGGGSWQQQQECRLMTGSLSLPCVWGHWINKPLLLNTVSVQHCRGYIVHLLQLMLVIETRSHLKDRIIHRSPLANIQLQSWWLTTFLSSNGVLFSPWRTSWTLIIRSKRNKGKKQDWNSRYTDDLKNSFWCSICHALTVNELKILPLSGNIKRRWNIQLNTILHTEKCVKAKMEPCEKEITVFWKESKMMFVSLESIKAPPEGHTLRWASP